MGGYPHRAHVIAADLDRLGQARPGLELRFARVDLAEARRLDRERRAILAARDQRIASVTRASLGD
jgi:allophanate hydrolase subunit 2